MQTEIRIRIGNIMPVILRIMTTIESPGAISENPMNIPGFMFRFIFSQNKHIGFHIVFIEGGGLSHKSFYCLGMALRQHGRDRIPLG
jgi:hypothetical protein